MWNQLPCHCCTSPYSTNGRPSPIDVYVMINRKFRVSHFHVCALEHNPHRQSICGSSEFDVIGARNAQQLTSAAHLSTASLGHFMSIENYGCVKCPRLALQLTYPGVSLYFCATRCFSEVQDLEFSPVSTVQMRWFLPSDLAWLKMGDLQTLGFPTKTFTKWDNSWGYHPFKKSQIYNFTV